MHHLDDKRASSQVDRILAEVESCKKDRNVAVLLFASPQVLVGSELPWEEKLLSGTTSIYSNLSSVMSFTFG